MDTISTENSRTNSGSIHDKSSIEAANLLDFAQRDEQQDEREWEELVKQILANIRPKLRSDSYNTDGKGFLSAPESEKKKSTYSAGKLDNQVAPESYKLNFNIQKTYQSQGVGAPGLSYSADQPTGVHFEFEQEDDFYTPPSVHTQVKSAASSDKKINVKGRFRIADVSPNNQVQTKENEANLNSRISDEQNRMTQLGMYESVELADECEDLQDMLEQDAEEEISRIKQQYQVRNEEQKLANFGYQFAKTEKHQQQVKHDQLLEQALDCQRPSLMKQLSDGVSKTKEAIMSTMGLVSKKLAPATSLGYTSKPEYRPRVVQSNQADLRVKSRGTSLKSSPTSSVQRTDISTTLISLQKIDGHWDCELIFLELTKTLQKAIIMISQRYKLEPPILATVLAISILMKFKGENVKASVKLGMSFLRKIKFDYPTYAEKLTKDLSIASKQNFHA